MDRRAEMPRSFDVKLYEKLQEKIAYADQNGICIDSIKGYFFNVYPAMRSRATTEDEIAFLRVCESDMVACYQRALERNYRSIRDYLARGDVNHRCMDVWTLTLDEEGKPQRTTVVAVNEKGSPIYADNGTDAFIRYELQKVWDYRYDLRKWLKSCDSLYDLKKMAQELQKKGRLGLEDIPSPNYNLDGLAGGQLDSAAWQNYTIESGLYRPTDYDGSLDYLLRYIDICLDFYEKAVSMVSEAR